MRSIGLPVRRLAAVLGAAALVACAPAAPLPAIVLVDGTAAAGLPAIAGRCLAVADFDGNGSPDIVLAETDGNAVFTGNFRLFTNRGKGTFDSVAVPTGLTRVVQCREGDFDGDGRADLAVIGSGEGLPTNPALVLLHNGGHGFSPAFPEATRLVTGVPSSVAFADLDGDGRQDLVVGTYSNPDTKFGPCVESADDLQCPPETPVVADPPTVLRNLGPDGFERAPHQPGTASLSLWIDAVDYDGDGRTDLFVSNDGASQLYRNTADGLVDVLPGWHANPYSHGMGAAFADFDHDGRLDFLVADAGPYQLWLGTAEGVTSAAAPWGLLAATRYRLGWSPVVADFDRDGWDDVFVANVGTLDDTAGTDAVLKHGTPPHFPAQADFVLRNVAGARFDPIEVPHRTRLPSISDGFTRVADFDADGWPDVIVVLSPLTPEVRLLRNATGDR